MMMSSCLAKVTDGYLGKSHWHQEQMIDDTEGSQKYATLSESTFITLYSKKNSVDDLPYLY